MGVMAQLIKYLLHNCEGLYLHTRTPRLMCKTLHSGVHLRLTAEEAETGRSLG